MSETEQPQDIEREITETENALLDEAKIEAEMKIIYRITNRKPPGVDGINAELEEWKSRGTQTFSC